MNIITIDMNLILNKLNNTEDIDSVNNLIDEISSALYNMRIDKSYYNDKLYRSLFNIRGKLYIKRNKLARKKKIA